MAINAPKQTPEPQDEKAGMPNEHPQKQSLFATISDALRKFSEFLGFGEKDENGKQKPNAFQKILATITGMLNGIDIEKWVEIKHASDIPKIREAFRPIIDLNDTAIELQEWDFIVFNKETGTVDFYPADKTQKSGHSKHPHGTLPITNPSQDTIDADKKYSENTSDDINGKIEKIKDHVSTPFSRLLAEKVRPYKSGPDSCGRAVRMILTNLGMKNPPQWHGKNWFHMMKNDPRFLFVPVNSVADIPPGSILTYNGKGTNQKGNKNPKTGNYMNQDFGHVEIMDNKRNVNSFYGSDKLGGSTHNLALQKDPSKFEAWKKATGFSGAFIPLAKNRDEAIRIKKSLS